MKKITALMLTALICISFAACTKTAENNSTATAVSSVSATENTTEQIIENLHRKVTVRKAASLEPL